MTNSIFYDNLEITMFAQKFLAGFRKEKKTRSPRVDVVSEQVKQMLQTSGQKLILMVRG